jgi:hypothetical protein
VAAGDLRALVTQVGEGRSYFMSVVMGSGWKVTASPVDSPVVIAERRVERRRTAEQVRAEFVRVALAQGIERRTDGSDLDREVTM